MPAVNSTDSSTAGHRSRPAGWTVWAAALRRLRTVRRAEAGVAALEFALFAPILFVSLLSMVDIGFALHERMTIDHVLRGGAQTAMEGGDEAAVLKVLQATAARNFTAEEVVFNVARYCACAEDPGVGVACSTTCAGPSATSIYYRLTGTKSYDGIFLPTMSLAPSVEVQLR